MSDSVRPHRRRPTRLPRPWDSPGKNTGVGCHSLLQRMKVKSEREVAQSCPTLSDPMDCSLPGSSVHGIFPGKSTGVGCHRLLRCSSYLIVSPKAWLRLVCLPESGISAAGWIQGGLLSPVVTLYLMDCSILIHRELLGSLTALKPPLQDTL